MLDEALGRPQSFSRFRAHEIRPNHTACRGHALKQFSRGFMEGLELMRFSLKENGIPLNLPLHSNGKIA
jgi:hypothetical protein